MAPFLLVKINIHERMKFDHDVQCPVHFVLWQMVFTGLVAIQARSFYPDVLLQRQEQGTT